MTNRRPVLPRFLMLAMFGMIGTALAGAYAGHAGGAGLSPFSGTVVAARDLVFEDRADGAVTVRSAPDGGVIQVFEGEAGFLRGTVRTFARMRRLERVGPEVPFRLTRWSDGRLTLDDPATGQRAELVAFGITNATVFAGLLGGTR